MHYHSMQMCRKQLLHKIRRNIITCYRYYRMCQKTWAIHWTGRRLNKNSAEHPVGVVFHCISQKPYPPTIHVHQCVLLVFRCFFGVSTGAYFGCSGRFWRFKQTRQTHNTLETVRSQIPSAENEQPMKQKPSRGFSCLSRLSCSTDFNLSLGLLFVYLSKTM